MDPSPVAPRYPVSLDLSGRPCLVVGAGVVATRKVLGLMAVDAHVSVIAPNASAEIAQAAADGAVAWSPRAVTTDDVATPGAWSFVIAASDDAAINARVVEAATRAGTWANDATAPDGGPAALPAVHRDGPVTLTVSTGGIHPGAATWLRDLAAGAIGAEHLTALGLAAEVRRGAPGRARPDWRAAVDSGMLDLIRTGREAEAKERLQACLSSSSD